MKIIPVSLKHETNKWGEHLTVIDTEGRTWVISDKKNSLWPEFEEGKATEVTLKTSPKGTKYIDTAKLTDEPVEAATKVVASSPDNKHKRFSLAYAKDLVMYGKLGFKDLFITAALFEEYLNGNIVFDRKDLLAYQIKLQNKGEQDGPY